MFSFDYVKDFDSEVAKAMEDELGRQRNNLELIASENLVSEAVMAAMGSHLTIRRRISRKTLLWWMSVCRRCRESGNRKSKRIIWL